MTFIRKAAVANMFYSGDSITLANDVDRLLSLADSEGEAPKALIAPHAGYAYSGPIKASAFHVIQSLKDVIRRVVHLGPSHRVAFHGLAANSSEYFETPLGEIPVDRTAVEGLLSLPQVKVLDEAHAQEHSLEVHLPFLQQVLKDFSLIPLIVGDATAQEVAEVLEQVWGGPETLILISSDLSHYKNYKTAQRMDKQTSKSIVALDPDAIKPEQACGRIPIQGLLIVAEKKGLKGRILDLRNSGDTTGARDQVVGYGAYAFA